MTAENKKDYVDVIYNEKDRPFTEYPDQLANYLKNRYEMQQGQKILDLGCGRGEFLRGFIRSGLQGYGVDQSTRARDICPEAVIKTADLENEALPFEDNTFDYIYSKSVLEHFYYPENLVLEIHRVLKPGGKVITLVPDWEVIYKIFYEDYTHRTPFTRNSLKDIFVIHGFKDVHAEKFLQLPFLWKAPWLRPWAAFVALMSPEFIKCHSKLVRFSKEGMLLSSAVKAHN